MGDCSLRLLNFHRIAALELQKSESLLLKTKKADAWNAFGIPEICGKVWIFWLLFSNIPRFGIQTSVDRASQTSQWYSAGIRRDGIPK